MSKQIFESKQQLVEAIEQVNDSGIAATDLALVVESDRAGNWSKPMTSDEFCSFLDELGEK